MKSSSPASRAWCSRASDATLTDDVPDRSPSPDAPPGFTLGPAVGGRPGVTMVYSGLDETGRPAACKTLHPEARSNPVVALRFAQECATLRTVPSCPFVVPLHARQPEGWLIMHWAHGGTLDERLRAQATWSSASIEHVVRALANGLLTLHRIGIVHRDLKPSNVLLDGEAVWIADFGIASRQQVDGSWRALPAPWRETAIGTPEWRAPELADAPPGTHPANDAYGLGRIWAALLTRCPNPSRAWSSMAEHLLRAEPAARATPAEVLALLDAV